MIAINLLNIISFRLIYKYNDTKQQIFLKSILFHFRIVCIWFTTNRIIDQSILSYNVFAFLFKFSNFSFVVDIDFDIHISNILFIWSHPEDTVDFFTLLCSDVIIKEEKCLLPMCVWSKWWCRKCNGRMTIWELDIKISDDCLKR